MDTSMILNYIRTEYPQLAEKSLQEEIAAVGRVITFKSGEIILDIGSYIKRAKRQRNARISGCRSG